MSQSQQIGSTTLDCTETAFSVTPNRDIKPHNIPPGRDQTRPLTTPTPGTNTSFPTLSTNVLHFETNITAYPGTLILGQSTLEPQDPSYPSVPLVHSPTATDYPHYPYKVPPISLLLPKRTSSPRNSLFRHTTRFS